MGRTPPFEKQIAFCIRIIITALPFARRKPWRNNINDLSTARALNGCFIRFVRKRPFGAKLVIPREFRIVINI